MLCFAFAGGNVPNNHALSSLLLTASLIMTRAVMNLLGDSNCIFLMLKKIMARMIRKTVAAMTTIMVARPVGRL